VTWITRFLKCHRVASQTARASAVGMTGGTALGMLGGPGSVVTVPSASGLGFVGGGTVGWIGGMINCKTGGGGGGGGRGSGSSARLTRAQQRQSAKYFGMKEVKGLTSQEQLVFEKNGRYFSFSNTSHIAGEVFKEVDRNGVRIATTDLNLNRLGP
jgi:hypothetical protein